MNNTTNTIYLDLDPYFAIIKLSCWYLLYSSTMFLITSVGVNSNTLG